MKRRYPLLLLIVPAFFGLFFPNWIIQALSFLMLFTLLVSYLYARICCYNIVAQRSDLVLRAHRNEKISVRFTVRNRGLLPIHFVHVRDIAGAFAVEEAPNYFFGLAPGEVKKKAYFVENRERGLYDIGPLIIRGSDPLGFFPWEKRLHDHLRVVIYPRVLPLRLLHKTGLPAGNIRCENKIYEDVTRYRSLKEYVPGDDTRRINWKVSARLGALYSMEFLPALSFPVLILLNMTEADFPLRYRSHHIERAIEVAASLVFYFISIGQDVGMITSGNLPGTESYHSIPIRGSYGHAMTLLECLAVLRHGAQEFTRLLFKADYKIPYGTRIVVVSPPLAEEQVRFLEMVERKGYNVEVFQTARLAQSRRVSHGFLCHFIKEYGDELIEE